MRIASIHKAFNMVSFSFESELILALVLTFPTKSLKLIKIKAVFSNLSNQDYHVLVRGVQQMTEQALLVC